MPLSVNKAWKDTESEADGAHNLRQLRRRIACSLAVQRIARKCGLRNACRGEMWFTQRGLP